MSVDELLAERLAADAMLDVEAWIRAAHGRASRCSASRGYLAGGTWPTVYAQARGGHDG